MSRSKKAKRAKRAGKPAGSYGSPGKEPSPGGQIMPAARGPEQAGMTSTSADEPASQRNPATAAVAGVRQQTTSTSVLPPAEAQKRLALTQQMEAALGKALTVMMMSPGHSRYSVADLRAILLPPLTYRQFSIAETGSREQGLVAPIGLVLWASVSDEIDARLAADPGKVIRLSAEDWKSGDNLWVIEAIGEPKATGAILRRLVTVTWRGRTAKIRLRDKDGQAVVRQIEAARDKT